MANPGKPRNPLDKVWSGNHAPRGGGINKRARGIIILAALLAVMAVVGTLALTGARFGPGGLYVLHPWGDVINLGLDLRGGVYTVYRGVDPGDGTFDALMDGTVNVLSNRLTAQGYTEAAVVRQGSDRIRIEIPAIQDPREILNIIGTPAVLQFFDPDGALIMEGKDVKTARAALVDNQAVVAFELTDEGAVKFAEATQKNIGRTISIQLDGRVISAPTVNSAITGGSGYIEGMAGAQEANQLALLIQSGALPLTIEQLEVSAISATLGVEALSRAVLAGVIALVIILLFMAAVYRLSGVAADIALILYLLAFFFILANSMVQLTLAGVLGVVLGIGMAVDANVVIFERIKEELRRGRPLALAARTGFSNAMSAVLDSNITTLIAAFVLMIFGTGTIKGFANTLAISVVLSMLTAVFVTRGLLYLLVQIVGPDKTGLFAALPSEGARRTGIPAFLQDHARTCLAVIGAVVVAALVLSVAGAGLNIGIDFTGGVLLKYEMGQEFDTAAVERAVRDAGYDEVPQIAKSGDDQTQAQIRVKDIDGFDEYRARLEDNLRVDYPGLEYLSVDRIGAVAGRQLVNNAIGSVLLAAALMLVYIAIRFDLFSGMAAVFGLLCDIGVMTAFMVFLRSIVQINSTFIAACLTIVGYSINNTIILFDRIRENQRKTDSRGTSRMEMVTRSVHETIGRTTNTTLTTLVAIVTLFILGVSGTREFALPLIIGIFAGLFSSTKVNGYTWAWLVERGRNWRFLNKGAKTARKSPGRA
ncbi:MAG: protein translocase subunit SecD [Oscillospiraceae bacterium]|jgi:SecD/SecF fusion protein|nr:protein translocase subunit SecD [Oscillospiraceae bacterium]